VTRDAGVAAARSGVAVTVGRTRGAGIAVAVLVVGVFCAIGALVVGSAAAVVSLTRDAGVAAARSAVAVTVGRTRGAGIAVTVLVEGVRLTGNALVVGGAGGVVSLTRDAAVAAARSRVAVTVR